ncbi:hypothetical protein E5676_scaffold575G00010 [Cucumis melo var. makuwa]|uniref:Uncharacterized protein n=1 Tax=Cucumis melo var. makuwa TaxID=1194695 RepID=A0A5D3E3H1_CUCMM|nr:hypothetical protein E6C27_scaffold708G00280 [Cucumis melo var. makuwa]TYK30339.1 hypothetical protein E5676_scaffold575G00010 [Cucumis melo var. makuwa]
MSLVMLKNTHISLMILKDAHISLMIPEDTHIRLVISNDAHISLVISKDAHISRGISKDTVPASVEGNGLSGSVNREISLAWEEARVDSDRLDLAYFGSARLGMETDEPTARLTEGSNDRRMSVFRRETTSGDKSRLRVFAAVMAREGEEKG